LRNSDLEGKNETVRCRQREERNACAGTQKADRESEDTKIRQEDRGEDKMREK